MSGLIRNRDINNSVQRVFFPFSGVLCVCLLVVVLLFSGHGFAREIVVSEELHYRLSQSSYIFYGDELDWQTVAAMDVSQAAENSGYTLVLDATKLPAWIRADIRVSSQLEVERWLLDIGNQFGGKATFYIIENNELISSSEMNAYASFKSRPVQHRKVLFPVELKPNSSVQVLLKISRTTNSIYHTHLLSQRGFFEYDTKETWFLGIHAGILLALTLYHLVLGLATKDKFYFSYSFYLVLCLLLHLSINGYGYAYVWSNYPWFQVYGSPVLTYAPAVAAIFFTISFLRLPEIAPRIVVIYKSIAAFFVLLALCQLFGFGISVSLTTIFSFLVYVSFIAVAIYVSMKGEVYANFYILAWALYILATTNWMLSSVGLFTPFTINARNVLLVALELQGILLAVALAHRIRTMRNEKLEAEADNRAKSSFLAKMSHEIRTPLSGVLGMSELLSDRLVDKTDRHYNDIIRSSGTALLTIINDILDYSKFTSGNMAFESVSFDVRRLVTECLDIFKKQSAEKNIELIVKVADDFPQLFVGDPTRVKQILLNFINNAIKFTEEGQICVEVSYQDNQQERIRIAVSDTGVGINEDDQKNLFKIFSQANETTSREYGGTGLGLAICKQLAELMGGEVGVESEPGKGSTFWASLKLDAGALNAESKSESLGISVLNKRLLIVEDNATYAELLTSCTKSWGMQCVVARDGVEALEKLRVAQEHGETFDLITLDWWMPRLNGMETSAKIEKDSKFKHIPRVLLTSAVTYPPVHELKKVGIRKVVEKPTLPSDLLRIFGELFNPNEASNQEKIIELSNASESRQALTILVAEDNVVNQAVIRGLLLRLDYAVDIVNDGAQAFKAIADDDKEYGLIFMDCEMPNMNGLEATAAIRAWEIQHDKQPIPIVALTAHAVHSQIELCENVGMNAYLTKPIELDKLHILLSRFSHEKDLGEFFVPDRP